MQYTDIFPPRSNIFFNLYFLNICPVAGFIAIINVVKVAGRRIMAEVEPTEKLYFDFLELLSKKGLFGEIDVSDKLRDHFKDDELKNLERYGDLNGFLKDITKYGHFTFRNETKAEGEAGHADWLSAIKASMSLTPDGLLFLYEKKKIDQTVKSNKLTLLFIIVTASIGLGSLIISSINLSFTIKNGAYKPELKQKEIRVNK